MWHGATEDDANTQSMLMRSAWYGYNVRIMTDCSPHQNVTALYEGRCDVVPFVIKIACPGREADVMDVIDAERTIIENFGTGHRNIMSLLDIPGFSTKYFIMPRYGLALDKIITVESHATVTNAERSDILRDVCAAILFLVSRGMVHGDVNLRNILTTPQNNSMLGHMVLTDFGFCHEAKKIAIDDVMQMSKYRQPGAVWLQAVADTHMFITDAIQFVKYIVCPLLGVFVREQIRNDVLVSISGKTMEPLAIACPATMEIFRRSISDMMLLSEVDSHRNHVKVINPLRVVHDVVAFVPKVINSRVRQCGIGGQSFINSKVLANTFELLVTFPRTMHRVRADESWTAFYNLFAYITSL